MPRPKLELRTLMRPKNDPDIFGVVFINPASDPASRVISLFA
jgi:hypothetical protein